MVSSSLRLHGPGDMIATLPTLLDSAPEDVIVLVLLRPGSRPDYMSVDAVMQSDLAGCLDHPAAAVDAAVRLGADHDTEQVDVFFIDSRLHSIDMVGKTARGAACWEFLVRLRLRLTEAGISLGGAWGATTVRAGAQWWSFLDTEEHGVVPDLTPSSTTDVIPQGPPA